MEDLPQSSRVFRFAASESLSNILGCPSSPIEGPDLSFIQNVCNLPVAATLFRNFRYRSNKAVSRAPIQVRHGLPVPISPFLEMLAGIEELSVYDQRIWRQWYRTTLAPVPQTIAKGKIVAPELVPIELDIEQNPPMRDAGTSSSIQRLADEFGRAIRPRVHEDNLLDKPAVILPHISPGPFHLIADRSACGSCRFHIYGK